MDNHSYNASSTKEEREEVSCIVSEPATIRFQQAAALLPPQHRRALEALTYKEQATAEEFRLRVGQPMTILFPEGERIVPSWLDHICREDLTKLLEIATQASAHTILDRLRNGFVTVRGGHRIGICGTAVMRDGVVSNFRQISSLSVRIAHEVPGVASLVLPKLIDNELQSTLILSPPGRGKTTLLRDLIRMISCGEGIPPQRVGVADERGELCAMYNGIPQMEVGTHTDVIDGCPKEDGLMMLLRGMNPQVLAADEITAPGDISALETAANCGVTLLATAHGTDLDDLRTRPLYQRLLSLGIFRNVVFIHTAGTERRYQVLSLGNKPC